MLVAVLAFSACGDDSSSSDETAAAPTEVATEAPTEAATEAPTEAPTEDAPTTDPTKVTQGDAGVKVTGDARLGLEDQGPQGSPRRRRACSSRTSRRAPARRPRPGRHVSVQYSGVLLKDGSKFDASWDRGGQPFAFALGQGMVIPGWDQGIEGMQKGGRRLLVIPPELAYGASGSGPIGPNEPLVFVVDMENITAP